MTGQEKEKPIIFYKLLFTIMIIVIYLIGRSLPLYGIDTSVYRGQTKDVQNVLNQVINGDLNQSSILALGISPYMIASILVQVIVSVQNAGSSQKISPKKSNYIMLFVMTIATLIEAYLHLDKLTFLKAGYELYLAKGICFVEMVTGVMLILWLSDRNKKYGIGGQTAIIFVNIIDGIISTLTSESLQDLALPLLISLLVMIVMLIMENTEKRIPLQRISIHNIYADKNYLAIKLNPIGVMPAMFSTAFFMIPQLITRLLVVFFPTNDFLVWMKDNMVLNKGLGIVTYIILLFILTISFSFVFVNPRDLTEQFLKSGDSIENLHAGKQTKRYLKRTVFLISLFSAFMMAICLGIPMLLQLSGSLKATLVMLPSSFMMLTGIWCSLYQECIAIRNYDEYRSFIF